MLLRFAAAITGGVIITAVMLISMSHFAAMFRERGGDRFFLIDLIDAPARGRPNRPGAAALPPQREVDRVAEQAQIGLEAVDTPDAQPDAAGAPTLPVLDDPTAGQATKPSAAN